VLKGEAKAAYMRDYMRRRRAGQAQPKRPTKPWEPSQRLIDQIAWAARHPNRVRGRLADAIAGLQFDTDEEWMEACYRWKAWTSLPKIEEPEPARERRCGFCLKPKSQVRRLVGDGVAHICDRCIEECAEVLQKADAAAVVTS
jgi:hypothetical protein